MQSISIFQLANNNNSVTLKNVSLSHEEKVSGQKEKLTTSLYVNQEMPGYRKCVIAMDEVLKLNARVFNQKINEVVVQNSYDIYFKEDDNSLICMANKDSSDNIKDFLNKALNVNYNKKIFDLNIIMQNSNNVRRAQFKNLTIQTLSGSSISGDQVNSTDLYVTMSDGGTLSTIALSFPFNNREISFSV